jgi:hypothetical protein
MLCLRKQVVCRFADLVVELQRLGEVLEVFDLGAAVVV